MAGEDAKGAAVEVDARPGEEVGRIERIQTLAELRLQLINPAQHSVELHGIFLTGRFHVANDQWNEILTGDVRDDLHLDGPSALQHEDRAPWGVAGAGFKFNLKTHLRNRALQITGDIDG